MTRLFFVHVMKTAGTSIVVQLNRHFDPERRHPPESPNQLMAKYLTTELTDGPTAPESIDFFAPHVPAAVMDRIGFEGTRLTLLRDPVERAISHLSQLVRNVRDYGGASVLPEELYRIPAVRDWFIANHQVRVFGVEADEFEEWDLSMQAQYYLPWWHDEPDKISGNPVGERHLDRALHALDRVDVVGVTERLDLFAQRLEDVTGYVVRPDMRANAQGREPVSAALREQLAVDSGLDLRLYEHAKALAGMG